jgi:hypothetical protein
VDPTPLLRALARRRAARLASRRPQDLQARLLARLIAKGARTRFGREHGLERVRGVDDYRRAVPLRSYEQFWDGYWKDAFPVLRGVTWPDPIPWFALSSGTTRGTTKYVPVSAATHRANMLCGLDVLLAHLALHPASDAAGGRSFVLGGSTGLTRLAPGVSSGDLSGIAAAAVPAWLEWLRFPPRRLALIADWEEKVEALARASLDADVRALAGVPSWSLILLERVAALRAARGQGGPPYPNLRMFVPGGVSFAPYRARFEALLGPGVDFREVYAASEGFIAWQDASPAEGLRLACDRDVFVELVPLGELDAREPRRFWVGDRDLEPGAEYALAVTTPSGLWSYLLGDVVRLVSRDPPRVTFAGRTAMMLSAFGEHVLGSELEAAATTAAAAAGFALGELSVMPVFPEGNGRPGGHLWVVEAELAGPDVAAAFAAAADRELARLNDDYRAHRSGGFGMAAPDVRLVPPGTFTAWMRRRGKLGGQNKVPRVVLDREVQDDLLTHCGFGRGRGGADGTSAAPPRRGQDLGDGTSAAPPRRGQDLGDGT